MKLRHLPLFLFAWIASAHFLFAQFVPENYRWDNVPIGGGGYLTGIKIHPSDPDLIYVKTDVGGAYRYDAEQNELVQMFGWIPREQSNLYGINGLALDPSDVNVIYAACGMYPDGGESDVYKSTDQGRTWSPMGLNVTYGGNFYPFRKGNILEVNPHNPQEIWSGSLGDGLWKYDGAAWSKVEGIPDGRWEWGGGTGGSNVGEGPSVLAFDPFDPQVMFVGVRGHGIYRSNDGGDSFAAISTMTNVFDMSLSKDADQLYAVFDTQGAYKLESPRTNDAWTSLDLPQNGSVTITASPHDNEVVMTAYARYNSLDQFYVSTDGGDSWEAKVQPTVNNIIPWQPDEYPGSAISEIAFNPVDPDKVYFTDWYSYYYTEDWTANNVTWTNDRAFGHEEVVGICILPAHPDNADAVLHIGSGDVSGLTITSLEDYTTIPNIRTTSDDPRMQDVSGMALAESDPNVVVAVGGQTWELTPGGMSISNDGGVTYSIVEAYERSWRGGKVVVAGNDKDNILVVTADGVKYTNDGGASFGASVGTNGNYGQGTWVYTYSYPMASDKVNGNFYLYDVNGDFLRSSNGGESFQRVSSLPSNGGDYRTLRGVFGQENHVLAALGGQGLWMTTDAGDNWMKLTGIKEAQLMDVGKAQDGSDYPTIYVFGKKAEDQISWYYRSTDVGATWQRVNKSPKAGNRTQVLSADRKVFGRFYVGTGGSGVYYAETTDQPAPPDTYPPGRPNNLSSVYTLDTRVEISWTAASDDQGVVGYKVYQDDTFLKTVTNLKATIGDLTENTAYNFCVSAIDEADNESERVCITLSTGDGELVENGEFDEGTTGWNIYTFAPDQATLSVSTDFRLSGANAGRVDIASPGEANWHIQLYQPVAVSQELAYEVSFTASADEERVVTAMLQQSGDPFRVYWEEAITVGPTPQTYRFTLFATDSDPTAWFKFLLGESAVGFNVDAVSFKTVSGDAADTTPPSAPTNVTYDNFTNGTLDLRWDAATDDTGVVSYIVMNGLDLALTTSGTSVELSGISGGGTTLCVMAVDASGNRSEPGCVEVTAGGTNLIVNGEFDEGTTGWDTYLFEAEAALSVATDANLSGENAGKVTVTDGGTENWHVQLSQTLTLTEGQSYQLSFMAKADSSTSLYLNIQENVDPYGILWGETINLTAEAQTFTFTVTPSAAATDAGLKFFLGAQTNTFYFDNFELIDPSATDSQAPTAPPELTVGDVTGTAATLLWRASTDNAAVSGYNVYNGDQRLTTVTTTTATLDNLLAQTSYTLCVRAVDDAGNESEGACANFTTRGVNILTNSEFDEGTSGWELFTFEEATGELSVVTDANLSGPNAGNVVITNSGTANWHLQLYQPVALKSGNTYQLQFTAKADEAVTLNPAIQQTSGDFAIYWGEFVTVGPEAQEFAFTFTAGQDDPEAWFKFFLGELPATSIYIDQVALYDADTVDGEAPTTPENVTVTDVLGTSATLSWDASTDNVGVSGYNVYLNGGLYGTVTETTATLQNIWAAATHEVCIEAVDVSGGPSERACTVLTTTGVNILVNSEFDEGTAGWDLFTFESEAELVVVSDSSLSGPNNGRVNITDGGTADWHLQLYQPVALTEGETYQLRFLAKAEAPTTVRPALQQSVEDYAIYWEEYVTLTTEPQQFTYTFEASATDADVWFKFFLGGTNVAVTFNDVQLISTSGTQVSECTARGSLLMEKWTDYRQNNLSKLKEDDRYPDNPTLRALLPSFETPIQAIEPENEFYVVRLRGYICAPESGEYHFWVSGDDEVALYVGSDTAAVDRDSTEAVAYAKAYTRLGQWNRYKSQKSEAIALEKGKSYYVEVMMRERWGLDHLQVGWSRPGEATDAPSEIVPGEVLSPYEVPGLDELSFYTYTPSLISEIILNRLGYGSKRSVSIFPNPAADVLNVDIAENQGEVTLTVLRLGGDIMIQEVQSGEELQIDVSDLRRGIYFLRVTGPEFNRTIRFFKR